MSAPNHSRSAKFAPPAGMTTIDERVHQPIVAEEWTFEWWSADGDLAGATMYRLGADHRFADYAWGVFRRGSPILHVVQDGIRRRADPMIAKAPGFWAEFTCEAPFEQWTLGNETHAVELDDPNEALGRGFGRVVPMASDLEWYATAEPEPLADGYRQLGVMLGDIETATGVVTVQEVPSVRSHRWSTESVLEPVWPIAPLAHFDARLPFRFSDGAVFDLVLTTAGWARRG